MYNMDQWHLIFVYISKLHAKAQMVKASKDTIYKKKMLNARLTRLGVRSLQVLINQNN